MLEVQNISFAYKGFGLIIKDVSFDVAPSDRVYIQAPSGTGKTTLCKLIAGYEQPQEGNVLLDDAPLSRKGVCPVQMIGQHPEVFLDPRMRMQDSLLEAGKIDQDLLNRLGIKQEWMSRFPHELSGGEMQRFCIARALAAQPKYLIADEISTMLDAVTQASIWKVILDEVDSRGSGLIFTTHSVSLAECLEPTKMIDIKNGEASLTTAFLLE